MDANTHFLESGNLITHLASVNLSARRTVCDINLPMHCPVRTVRSSLTSRPSSSGLLRAGYGDDFHIFLHRASKIFFGYLVSI